MGKLVGIGEASKHFGVSKPTLRRWDEKGLLVAKRTENGHRRYDLSEVTPHPLNTPPRLDRKTIAYARVLSSDQKNELRHQRQFLEAYCSENKWVFETIVDLGSGVDYKKDGLKTLIEKILDNKVERLVVTQEDRLLSFGAELIFMLCDARDVEVVIINHSNKYSFEQELAQDISEIITVFSERFYGSRSKTRQKITDAVNKALS